MDVALIFFSPFPKETETLSSFTHVASRAKVSRLVFVSFFYINVQILHAFSLKHTVLWYEVKNLRTILFSLRFRPIGQPFFIEYRYFSQDNTLPCAYYSLSLFF
jgi:hypothetical protein